MQLIKITALYAAASLIFASLSPASEDQKFVPDDPPRRAYSNIRYEQAAMQQPTLHTIRQSNQSFQVRQSRFANGRQLVGTVHIALKKDAAQSIDPSQVRLLLVDGDQEYPVVKTSAADGVIEFDTGGLYATAVKVVLPQIAGTDDPIASIRAQSIVLGTDTRIMLLGDSITHGKFADDFKGYRHMLYDRLDGDGYNIDFVGDFGDPPYEAHFQGGEKINDFYPRGLSTYATGEMDVTTPMNQYRPNIVAIHLGTNDLNSETGMALTPYGRGDNFYDTQAGEMGTLIHYLLKWHNGVYGTDLQNILVSLIIPIKYRDSVCVELNLELVRLVNDFRSGAVTGQPEPVELVDHFSRFREWPGLTDNYYKALMYDSLHPNNAGHSLMADTYYESFVRLLTGQQNWFTDITGTADLHGRDIGYNGDFAVFENQGVAVADIDGDGVEDIYATRTNSDNPEAHDFLYRKSDALPYSDVSTAYQVSDPGGSRGAIFVDVDGDGDLDLFNAASGARNRLYRNDGSQFTDATSASGIADPARVTTAVLAADFDGDSDLDLYAVNSRENNEFYLNDGDGYFQLIDRGADDKNEPSVPSLSASAVDFDNDNDVDIYIVKRGAANVLFVNDGSGYFTENAAGAGIALQANCNGATWADLDNDGDLDLLVAETALDGQSTLLHAFENDAGIFADRTNELAIDMSGYSPVAADFDNDGDIDILATQESDYAVYFQNEGDWNFVEQNNTGAEIHGGDIRGAVAFDYDADGDLDIFAARADMFNILLQNNLAATNNFINISADGPNGDKGGIGSKIRLYETGHLNDSAYLISYAEILSANGHISQPSPTQHFGLAAQSSCDILVRFIDGSYAAQRSVAANQTVYISPSQAGIAGDPALISLTSGDGQQGIVGEDLADPLVVKVTDEQGRAVPDIDVVFQVTAGDARLYLPESSSEKISIQPESGQLSGLQRVSDASASGGAFVMPAENNGPGSATMQKEIPNDGAYYLWLRAWNSGASQTVALHIDGIDYAVAVPTTESWQWLLVETQPLALTAGTHSFDLTISSAAIQCDKLLLLLNGAYTPSGLEDDAGNPTATDASGLARRYVKLGDSAGPATVEADLTFGGALIPDSPIVFNLTALAGPAASMQKTSGDNQNGQQGAPLTEPFVVTLFDALGNPTPNVQTTFTILSGGGSLTTDDIVLTDSRGRAQTTLIPGGTSSVQRVQAEAANVSGSPVVFQATINGVASEMKYISGDGQSGVVKSILPSPIKVQVLAENSQPAIDFAVRFSTPDEGALLSSQTTFTDADSSITMNTDANGYAQVWRQLGDHSGSQQTVIDAGSLIGSPLTVHAEASPASPAYLLLISGDAQTGRIQETLAQPFVVKLLDAFGNGTPGHSIIFQAEPAAGVFAGAQQKSIVTDSLGIARAYFTPGTTAGENIKLATANAIINNTVIAGSPVNFHATLLPGSAALAEKAGGDNQSGTVDSDLSQPFVVRVTDSFGNPVAGKTITFDVVAGNGSLNRSSRLDVSSDANGLAAALYHVGTTAGEHRIRAACSGLTPAEHEFTVQALPDAPYALDYVSGNDQQGGINVPLPEPLVVRVADRFGNAVPGGAVVWQVLSAGGSFNGEREKSTTTDSNGESRVSFTLGAETGDSLYSVRAAGAFNGAPLQNSPIQFIASAAVGEPTALIALSPTEDIIGAANHELQAPIRVKVTDANGLPAANFSVDFDILAGGGRFAENNSAGLKTETDASGVAEARWILGALGAPQHMRCMALRNNEHLQNSPIFFNATTVQSQPQQLIAVSGDGQTGAENSQLPAPFIVKVVDEFGAPFADQPVVFSITKGDGVFIESGTAVLMRKTASTGEASARLRLGSAVGENAYIIAVQSFSSSGLELQGSPLTFQASGTAKRLQIIYGDNQSGVVNTLLPRALKIQATDETGAGIPGLTVKFSTLSGAGEFTGNADPQTNSNGIARVQYKLGGKSGPILVKAAAPDIGGQVLFHLFALPDDPVSVKVLSGDGQTGIAGHRLNQEIVVKVVDQYDNGVNGVETTFSTQPGQGRILPAAHMESDSAGLSRAQWILGAAPGEQLLFISSEELMTLPLQVTATALPNQAPQITLPDSFAVNEKELLSFSITVSDAENDTISLSLQNLPDGAAFDESTRLFSWTPGYDQAGVYPLIIQARDHVGARRIKATTIIVHNLNRPPVISVDDSQPRTHQLGRVDMQAAVDFSVAASDPDNDPLHYLWQVNGRPISAMDHFTLQAQLLSPGPATVAAFVFDQSDTARTTWSLQIITAIKLAFFKAEFKPYKGALLSWKTRYEWGNLGFYVQRATRRDGPFTAISPLIESTKRGDYNFVDAEAESGEVYFYRLQNVQADGARQEHPIVSLTPPKPDNFALHANFPNPFNPSTTIRFDIAEKSHVTLKVFDILGRHVDILIDRELNPGFHSTAWNGRNADGASAASGVYYALLDTPKGRFVQKMLLLR